MHSLIFAKYSHTGTGFLCGLSVKSLGKKQNNNNFYKARCDIIVKNHSILLVNREVWNHYHLGNIDNQLTVHIKCFSKNYSNFYCTFNFSIFNLNNLILLSNFSDFLQDAKEWLIVCSSWYIHNVLLSYKGIQSSIAFLYTECIKNWKCYIFQLHTLKYRFNWN